MSVLKYRDSSSGILFSKISAPGVKTGSKYVATGDYILDSSNNIVKASEIINSIDIDWNSAYMPNFGKTINTTGDLIKAIDDISANFRILQESEYAYLTSYDKNTLYFVTANYTLVEKPVSQSITYDGQQHSLESTESYTVTGSGGADRGTYTFIVTLNDGYMWDDKTRNVLTITYTIQDAIISSWTFGGTFPIIFS